MPKHALIFQKHLVVYGASTLARLKTGSLFRLIKKEVPDYMECMQYFNQQCSPYGYEICVLSETNDSLLVYVYNAQKLGSVLSSSYVQNFLSHFGYTQFSISRALHFLKYRLETSESFPHEIGLFLGYPMKDVQSFINAKEALYIGYWKVYGNVKKSKKAFTRFDCCRNTMQARIMQGEPLVEILKKLNVHTSHLT